jgi:hypothetical protein
MQEPQTFDNRLLKDERWQISEEIHEYYQKFNNGDPILIQFTTNLDISNVTAQLFDDLDNQIGADLTIVLAYAYTDGSGLNTYEIFVDTIGLSLGKYYFKINASNPALEFTSEGIEIGLFQNLPYVQWRLSDRDGIVYKDSTIFGFRIDMHVQYSAISENSIYEGFNFQPELLYGVAKRQLECKIVPAPRYITEKIELAFKHEQAFINRGVNDPTAYQYSANGSAKITQIDKSNLYDCEIVLIETLYEDYSLIQELKGKIVNTMAYTDFDDVPYTDVFDLAYDGLR